VVVLLYDRTFLCRSFREVLRRRWAVYAGLGASWVLLAAMVIPSGGRGATAGFGRDMTVWEYARTQFGVVVNYLRLCFWPHPLIIDYGTDVATGTSEVVPQASIVAALLACTLLALRYRPRIGFLGAWLLLILAPSSSIVPVVTETAAERRMYLPLAAVVAIAVMAAHAVLHRLPLRSAPSDDLRGTARQMVTAAVVLAVVCAMGYRAILRNDDYHSRALMWETAVRHRPRNARAHYNLGVVYQQSLGRQSKALEQFNTAIQLRSDYAEAYNNRGLVYRNRREYHRAIEDYTMAIRHRPDYAQAYSNRGVAHGLLGHWRRALEDHNQAVENAPHLATVYNNRAQAHYELGEPTRAISDYTQAIRLKGDYVQAYCNRGIVYNTLADHERAIDDLTEAIRLDPDCAKAYENRALAYYRLKAHDKARADIRKCQELGGRPDPRFVEILSEAGRPQADRTRH
jgi:Tfp pilus assembly protein PilF